MKLNENIYLTSDSWFQASTRVATQYQTLYPIKIPIYHHDDFLNRNYGSFWEQQKYEFAPYNMPIDSSICYAGNKAESPVNDVHYLRLSDMPAEQNRLYLGFTSSVKNGVAYMHDDDNNITLNGTLNTSSNTILIFDLNGDYSSSTEYPKNPFQGHPGAYTISATGNTNIRIQLYGFNSDLQLVSIFNGSNGGTVNIDNSYQYYVFRIWIAGSASFNNYTFTCKCTLVQQRSVQKYSANSGVDGGLFYALGASGFLGGSNHDGLANRNCYYTDTSYTAQSRTNGFCCPITQIRYNDVVYLIYVECATTPTGTTIYRYTLNEYKNTYQTRYPYIRAFYMVPYIGNPDEGINRVPFEADGYLSELISDITRTIALIPTNGLAVPNNINISNIDNDIYYHYGGSLLTMCRGTYFGIPEQSYRPKQGGDDFSDCSTLNACCPCRVTDDFVFDVEGDYCYAHFASDLQRIIDICAWYGVPFTESTTTAQTASVTNPTDEKLHIPIITDGYITGEYMSGTAAAELPNISWSDNFRDKNDYDGAPAEHFDDVTVLNTNTTIKSDDIFTHVYWANYLGIESLANWLYGVASVGATSDELLEKFLTLNPIDCVADLILYPFIISPYAGVRKPVIIGNQTFSSNNIYKIDNDIFILDFGTLNYRRKYDDFRDFEPYSDCTLQIPYHGDVHLKPSIYCGHDITVKCIIDMLSGASIALVYRDRLVMDSIPGQIGMHVQLSGMQTASYNAALYSAANGYKQAAAADVTRTGGALLSIAGNIGTGNFAGAVSSAFSGIMSNVQSQIALNNADYRLDHVQVPFKTRGTNSVLTSYGNEQCCRLILTRPKMLTNELEVYAHTQGYACCMTAKLSSVSGYTVVSAADLSGLPISAQEKSMLLKILQSGFYM